MSPAKRLLPGVASVVLSWLAADARADGPASPLFSRHVVPVLSKLGCNAGACHGAVQGQGGLRLSLFGAEPGLDHARLARELGGRRLNLLDADSSLLLLKATARVPHLGGKRTSIDSADYAILRDWVAQGAGLDPVSASQLKSLRVEPAQHTLPPQQTYQLRVQAAFADGSTEDVTALCTFESTNKDVAGVDRSGRVEACGTGDAALIVRFRAEPVVASVLVPGPALAKPVETTATNFIDKLVNDKLRRLNIEPSPLSDDAAFLRRASLDIAGELPGPEEIRKFLADTTADKRSRKIDELLGRPGHAALWASKFCDILKPVGFNGNHALVEHLDARRFHAWIRARLAEGVRYDELVERILTATSREGRPAEAWVAEVRALVEEATDADAELKVYSTRRTLDLYWQKSPGSATGGNAPVKSALQVAHAFLGLRLECAQCHRHPHDVWQQQDLLDFASFFSTMSAPGGQVQPDVQKLFDAKAAEAEQKKKREQAKAITDRLGKEKSLPKEEADKLRKEADTLNRDANILYNMAKRIGTETHTQAKGVGANASSPLGTFRSTQMRLLGQVKPIEVPAGQDPRAAVMAWFRQPDNPYFATALVNRVWAHYFERGLVDPADQLSPLNPASHPELLNELSDGFIKSGYDLKWLQRTIVTSRTYQASSRALASNRHDQRNFARYYLRRLPAELVLDAINHATGAREAFPPELRMAVGARVLELAGGVPEGSKEKEKAATLAYALKIFGRPLRNPDVQCDCEREGNAAMVQSLYLMNHPAVREKLANATGAIATLAKEQTDDGLVVDEAFLRVLCRLPVAEERAKALDYLKNSPARPKGIEGLFRTLMLSDEFLLNH